MPEEIIRQSEEIVRAARRSLEDQRRGGRRRKGRSLGRGSAKLKTKHWLKKLRNMGLVVGALWIAASIIGVIIDGLDFEGVAATAVATIVAVYLLAKYPKLKEYKRSDLKPDSDNIRDLVAKTEYWLEKKARYLPKPTARSLSIIGDQLDDLQHQLEEVDHKHPTAAEIRRLIGRDLPEMIDGFLNIPEKLRYEERAGSTPVKQLDEGLEVISREIDSISRQLAEGSLDTLAVKRRFLDYKYGENSAGVPLGDGGSGVPLPDLDQQKTTS